MSSAFEFPLPPLDGRVEFGPYLVKREIERVLLRLVGALAVGDVPGFDVIHDSCARLGPAQEHKERSPRPSCIAGLFDVDVHGIRLPVTALEGGNAVVHLDVAGERSVGRVRPLSGLVPQGVHDIDRCIAFVLVRQTHQRAAFELGEQLVIVCWSIAFRQERNRGSVSVCFSGPKVNERAPRRHSQSVAAAPGDRYSLWMKAALFHEHGGPDVLRIEDVPEPVPAPGEVRLRVRAAALNHLDLFVRRGLPHELVMPHIGGSDVAGIIDEIGEGVTGWHIGERVVVDPSLSCGHCAACQRGEDVLCETYRILGEHVAGAFAEYVVVPAANLFRVPADFDDAHAAAAPLTFLTAWRGLVTRGRLRSGESLLVTGASGGAAIAAIRIARYLGARILAITSTPFVDRVRALGVDSVFDRNDPDHRRSLFDATGRRGVDVVFDSVGQATHPDNVRALARAGRLVIYGATSGPHAEIDLRYIFWKQMDVLGTTMANRSEFEAVMKLVFRRDLVPVVDGVLPLEQIRAAHERLERGEAFGKIVLVP